LTGSISRFGFGPEPPPSGNTGAFEAPPEQPIVHTINMNITARRKRFFLFIIYLLK
jgi:hypothetical protein